jgi:hypothetical protein
MPNHPDFYTDLLRRRFVGSPPLTPAERAELALHLLICPQCNFDYAALLAAQAPERAAAYWEQLAETLDADVVTPYLHDLARARRAGRPLNDLQAFVWQYVCRDPVALGNYRLIEASLAWAQEH